ncbi:MAG: ShlB/FhaC/HecB family hemolysin secretion/activation protein, partial [Veillonella sp.]
GNTVYDMYSSSRTTQANLEKILFRNQKSKVSFDAGIKQKHNQKIVEDVCSDRIYLIESIDLV